MSHATEGPSPLAAYEELMHFAKRRGESAVRLAMHAAVPQGFQPELLHLLRRNFVPEAGDDPVLEADILFSPLCEELGRGFFRFYPQVRSLLLENLVSNYATEPEPRIVKVADFLLAYVDHHDRSASGPHDQLWRDYLEMQRWVAFAFVDPAGAAQQLAAALENANASDDFVARIQLGGLASALEAPLQAFPSLLNYAAGLQALELGDRKRAGELFESLQEEEMKVGNVTLRSASQVLNEWQSRHPDYVATDEPKNHGTFHDFHEAIQVLLRYKDPTVRRRAAKSLGQPNAPEEAVRALIDSLNDQSSAVREASVHALAQIRTQPALLGLANALSNLSAKLQRTVLSRLKQMEQRLALITSSVDVGKDVSDVIYDIVMSRGYLPVFWSLDQISNLGSSEISDAFDFVIADVTESRRIFRELEDLLRLSIPVQPIAQGGTRVPARFADLQQRYPSLMRTIVYDNVSTLSVMLGRNMSSLVSKIQPKSRTFEFDVFISFSNSDRIHVQAMSGVLSRYLTSFLGREPAIFMENDSVMSGQFDNEKIFETIDRSAVFIFVISSSSLKSEWFQREFEAIEGAVGLQANQKSRILKVLTEPISLEDQPASLRNLLGYNFFETDSVTGKVTSFTFEPTGPIRKRYFGVIDSLARDIAQLRNEQSERSAPVSSEKQERPAIDRWQVRTGIDSDVTRVKPDPDMTTVEELIAQPRPDDMPLSGKAPAKYQSGRAAPVETTTWSFDAEVRGFRRSVNRTYRLILVGNSGATMIAKLPDPKRMRQSSPWLSSVVAVRNRLEERLRFTNAYTYLTPPLPVHLMGIGHFGRPHGQAGAAPNGVELQPIIGFEWGVDEQDASQDLKLQSQGVVEMERIQDEINHGQRMINYMLCQVDMNTIDALKHIIDILKTLTEHTYRKDIDFSRAEAAIVKADEAVSKIAEIRPPGVQTPYPYQS